MRRRLYIVLPVLLIAAGIAWIFHGSPAAPGPAELRGRGTHHAVVVRLEPRLGPLDVRVELHPASPADVSISAVMPHMGHTTPELQARSDGPGRYVARGELFTMTGPWEIGVRVHDTSATEVIKVNTLITA
ncbi:FixH family protein [Nonomuraea sp. KM88]|uniref:FixH family protein n=1 Tax=Nonomuraea sp. KM88 TaxID=3457427 RepID=UPI003FCDCE41